MSANINVRISEADKSTIEAAAKARGQDLSSFIRSQMLALSAVQDPMVKAMAEARVRLGLGRNQ